VFFVAVPVPVPGTLPWLLIYTHVYTREKGQKIFLMLHLSIGLYADQITLQPGTPVWVTETGSPVSGDSFGAAVPSIANAQSYWSTVACAAFSQVDIFWYAYQDYNSNPSFGVIGANGQPLYNLAC